MKIKTINIHALRGIPDLELQLNGKSLLLRGENGTGKSSIVDAIEFFFTGKIPYLEGTRGLSLQRHGPHVNFESDNTNVELTFNPGNVHLSRTFADIPSSPEQFKQYFQITQKGTFILRRSQILTFIMSKPADRYRAIGSIIGVESLDEIELKMMRIRDDLKSENDSNKEKIRGLIATLSTIMGIDITKVEDVIPALNKILQEANLPLIRSLEDVDNHAEEMLKTIKRAKNIDRIGMLNEVIETTKTKLISEEIITEFDDFNNKVKQLLQEDIRLELSIAELLKSGQKVIEKEDEMDICPLCEQIIDREILLTKIEKRLIILRDLSEKASEIRRLSVPLIKKLNEITDELKTTISKIESFPELAKEKNDITEKITSLNEIVSHIVSAKDLKNEIPVRIFDQQKNEINEVWRLISTKCNQLLDTIGLTESEKKVLNVISLINHATSKTTELSSVLAEIKIYQNRFDVAEKIYSTFSDTKKAKIQGIYDSIQGNIQSFYSMLHPSEPHKNVELTVALGKRASTELSMESFGRKREDPRALTSEGHLDSLGLCIFLGFIKKFNEDCSLIILDDIVTTIDANHRKRIAQLLLEEFGDKQLIITTHDGIWYDELVSFQRAHRVQSKFENIEIVEWDISTGPITRRYKPKWGKILEKLENKDKNGAGNETRIYVEWILKQCCTMMESTVVFKDSGKYTVAELLDSAESRITKLLKESDLKTDQLEQFKELRATVFMGNLLSHDNPQLENLSFGEIEEFCNATHDLHNSFLCPECENFLQYFRTSDVVRCSNLRCDSPTKVETKR